MSRKIAVLEDQLKAAENDERYLNQQLADARKRHEQAQETVTRIRRELTQAMKEEIAAAKEGQS
jgi:F0F1-type ATP synthase membrane subunit b/b'